MNSVVEITKIVKITMMEAEAILLMAHIQNPSSDYESEEMRNVRLNLFDSLRDAGVHLP